MNRNRPALLSMIFLALPVSIPAQSPESELPIEPSRLGQTAANPEASVEPVGNPGLIESDRGEIEVIATDISLGNRTERGIRLTLDTEDQTDALYLDSDQALQFRQELEELALHQTACAGMGDCTFGIERCGMVTAAPEAYCPAIYYTREGETGFGISTPGNHFRFPGVQLIEVVAVVETAILELGE